MLPFEHSATNTPMGPAMSPQRKPAMGAFFFPPITAPAMAQITQKSVTISMIQSFVGFA